MKHQSIQIARSTRSHSALLWWLCVFVSLLASRSASALILTADLEAILVKDVGSSWVTVNLDNIYSNAIPICTYNLGTFAGSAGSYTNIPAVPRIRNITSSSFQLRVQGWENIAPSAGNVHCLVSDEGAFTLPDGREYEAHTVVSDKTVGQYSTDGGWITANLEDVSADIQNTYTNPVVLGQVISYNDSQASVIYVNDCDARGNHPFQSGMADGICVGKHIGMIPDVRADETIGYLVAEAGSGTVNNVDYELARGSDSVRGNTGSNAGYTYGQSNDYNIAVLTQAAEDGGNGSWAVLYGADPLPNNSMVLAVDEEEFAGDATRGHTTEQVYYWSFAGADITLTKTVVNDDSGTSVVADFTLTATGLDTISGVSGDSSITNGVVQPGTYVLSESVVPGYVASNWTCTGTTVTGGDTITANAGDNIDCSITNDDSGTTVDVSVVKTVNDYSPNIGDAVTFTLQVANAGPDIATSVSVNDQIPAGFTYVATSISGGDSNSDSDPAGAGLSWSINSLGVGATTNLTFQAVVLPP
jgi:uncharacterized repeat protein (TIGR01451 family)